MIPTCVQSWIAACESAKDIDPLVRADPTYRTEVERTDRLLKRARIFEVKAADYIALHHDIDVYTTEVLAGYKWTAPGEGVQPTKEESRRLFEVTGEHGSALPFPEPLPFEVCWFGLDRLVELTRDQIAARVSRDAMMMALSR